jgi:hypothetical protein
MALAQRHGTKCQPVSLFVRKQPTELTLGAVEPDLMRPLASFLAEAMRSLQGVSLLYEPL